MQRPSIDLIACSVTAKTICASDTHYSDATSNLETTCTGWHNNLHIAPLISFGNTLLKLWRSKLKFYMTQLKQYNNYCDRVFVAFKIDIIHFCSVWFQPNSKQGM